MSEPTVDYCRKCGQDTSAEARLDAAEAVVEAAQEVVEGLTGKPWAMVPGEADALAKALAAYDELARSGEQARLVELDAARAVVEAVRKMSGQGLGSYPWLVEALAAYDELARSGDA